MNIQTITDKTCGITAANVINAVIDCYGVSAEHLFGPGRMAVLCDARMTCAVLLSELLQYDKATIASVLRRDRATIDYYLRVSHWRKLKTRQAKAMLHD